MARNGKHTLKQPDKAKPKSKSKKPSKDLRERFAKVAMLGGGSNNQVLTRLVVACCVMTRALCCTGNE